MFDRTTLLMQLYAIARQAGDDHKEALENAQEAATAFLTEVTQAAV